jgi:DNA-binding transcriptional MerR regulator
MDGVTGRTFADGPDTDLDLGEAQPRRASKSAAAFRTISEVATDLDVPPHVLRFWESKFPQIKPLKRGGGRRYYRPEDVELLRRIKELLYTNGYTIKGVQKLLRGGKATDPDDVAAPGTVPGAGAPPTSLAATPIGLAAINPASLAPAPATPLALAPAVAAAPEPVAAAVAQPTPRPAPTPAPVVAAPIVVPPTQRAEPSWRDAVRSAIADLEAIRDSLARSV